MKSGLLSLPASRLYVRETLATSADPAPPPAKSFTCVACLAGAQNAHIRSGGRPITPDCPVDQIGGSGASGYGYRVTERGRPCFTDSGERLALWERVSQPFVLQPWPRLVRGLARSCHQAAWRGCAGRFRWWPGGHAPGGGV